MGANSATSVLGGIRAGAKASGLGKKLFSQGNSGISPAQITQELRAVLKLSGIDLPQGVAIGLDTAQIILAGGVLVSDIQQGVAIGQMVNPSTLAISGAANLLSDLGLLDPQVSDFIGLGVNTALAISSCGTDVLADIGVVLSAIQVTFDVISDVNGYSQDQLDNWAKARLAAKINSQITPQVNYAATQIQAYNAGNLNFFDLIGNIALNAGNSVGFIPQIAAFLPSWMIQDETLVGSASEKSYFMGFKTSDRAANEIYNFKACVTNKQILESYLINTYIVQPMQQYFQFLNFNRDPVDGGTRKSISLNAIAKLSLVTAGTITKPIEIGFDTDILAQMIALGVTPSKLGDDWLFKGMFTGDQGDPGLPYTPQTLPPATDPGLGGMVVNGRPVMTPAELSQKKYFDSLVSLQKLMQYLDSIGDIASLMQIPEAKTMLTYYANFGFSPIASQDGEISNLALKAGSQSIKSQSWWMQSAPGQWTYTDPGAFWKYIRKNYVLRISDYWKCLGTLKQMESANLFKDKENILVSFGDIDKLLAETSKLQKFIIAKKLNYMAQTNVASYLGTTPDKLKMRIDPVTKSTIFRKVS